MALSRSASTIAFTLVLAHSLACAGPNHALEHLINSACLSGDDGPFYLAGIPELTWDRLYVFPPYTTPQELRSELQASWEVLSQSGIEHRDDITLLAFTYEGLLRSYTEQPRTCDFAELGRAGGWPRDSAIFAMELRMLDGQLWVTLRPRVSSPAACPNKMR